MKQTNKSHGYGEHSGGCLGEDGWWVGEMQGLVGTNFSCDTWISHGYVACSIVTSQ